MSSIIQEMIILLSIIVAGVFCNRLKLLTPSGVSCFNNLIIKFAFPALIIASMDKEFTDRLLRNSIWLIIIASVCYATLIAAFEIWKKFSRLSADVLSLYQFLILFGNAAFMGLPVAMAIYGNTGVFYASMFNLVHNFVCFSYGIRLLQRNKTTSWKSIFLNPGFVATVIGFIIFIIPGTLPYIIYRPMEWVGDMTIPICLLIVGNNLSHIKMSELIKPPAIWLTSLTRLILFPAVVYVVLNFLGFREYLLVIPTVIFATPVALSAASFSSQYGKDEHTASKAVILSNILAMVTMPILVILIL